MKTITFQGEKGAFSDEAAHCYYCEPIKTIPCREFETVFEKVNNRECDEGIVPIENSLTGSIHTNIDSLLNYKLYITGEIIVRIQHHLLSLNNSPLSGLRKILSHPQALKQCSSFLKYLKNVEIVAAHDTAGAAKYILSNNCENYAAIAGKLAAKEYGLKIIKKNIENHDQNYTRFVILEKDTIQDKKCRKISIVLSLPDKPGSLYTCLGIFKKANINLIKIESRPVIGYPWKYYFYIDFENTNPESIMESILKELKSESLFFRLLGIYPKGRIIE
ncbi:MAG: prephenate dehydratase [bacterium]